MVVVLVVATCTCLICGMYRGGIGVRIWEAMIIQLPSSTVFSILTCKHFVKVRLLFSFLFFFFNTIGTMDSLVQILIGNRVKRCLFTCHIRSQDLDLSSSCSRWRSVDIQVNKIIRLTRFRYHQSCHNVRGQPFSVFYNPYVLCSLCSLFAVFPVFYVICSISYVPCHRSAEVVGKEPLRGHCYNPTWYPGILVSWYLCYLLPWLCEVHRYTCRIIRAFAFR